MDAVEAAADPVPRQSAGAVGLECLAGVATEVAAAAGLGGVAPTEIAPAPESAQEVGDLEGTTAVGGDLGEQPLEEAPLGERRNEALDEVSSYSALIVMHQGLFY